MSAQICSLSRPELNAACGAAKYGRDQLAWSVIRAGVRRGRLHAPGNDQMLSENKRLHGEVEQLKDRIKVLERIAVEKENSLAREIESLRDR